MSEMKNSEILESTKPVEERIKESAAELESLLRQAPRQQCRAESDWNESDDFIDRFNDIWGEQVG